MCSALTAAKAAGIDRETFESWMQQADAEPGPARDLRDKIALAETEAQAADSEIELRKKNPNAWLSRKRRAQPGRPHRAPSKSIALQETLGGLTVKHRQFVTEYLKDFNGAQAAIRAGYTPSRARTTAAQIMARPDISAAIAAAMKKAMDGAEFDLKRWVREVWRLALLDPAQFFDDDGNLLPVHETPLEARRALTGVEIEELYDHEQAKDLSKFSPSVLPGSATLSDLRRFESRHQARLPQTTSLDGRVS